MDKEKQDLIFKIRNESQSLYRANKYQEAIDKLKEAWNLLPEPREKSTFSNVLASEIAASYLEDVQNYPEALNWGNTLISCYEDKIDSGEGEFMKGKIYYEMKDMDEAREQFAIAMKKSEGRAFEGEDKKYINLLKNK